MKKTIGAVIIAGLLIAGCADNSNNDKTATQSPQEEGHHHEDASTSIELNNGEKWKVDNNMLRLIRKMENDVAAFGTSTEYAGLAGNLTASIDTLTSSCTMKGKAHDELHKWLLPYIDMVDSLSTSETEKEAADMLAQIRESFVTFNKYFE